MLSCSPSSIKKILFESMDPSPGQPKVFLRNIVAILFVLLCLSLTSSHFVVGAPCARYDKVKFATFFWFNSSFFEEECLNVQVSTDVVDPDVGFNSFDFGYFARSGAPQFSTLSDDSISYFMYGNKTDVSVVMQEGVYSGVALMSPKERNIDSLTTARDRGLTMTTDRIGRYYAYLTNIPYKVQTAPYSLDTNFIWRYGDAWFAEESLLQPLLSSFDFFTNKRYGYEDLNIIRTNLSTVSALTVVNNNWLYNASDNSTTLEMRQDITTRFLRGLLKMYSFCQRNYNACFDFQVGYPNGFTYSLQRRYLYYTDHLNETVAKYMLVTYPNGSTSVQPRLIGSIDMDGLYTSTKAYATYHYNTWTNYGSEYTSFDSISTRINSTFLIKAWESLTAEGYNLLLGNFSDTYPALCINGLVRAVRTCSGNTRIVESSYTNYVNIWTTVFSLRIVHMVFAIFILVLCLCFCKNKLIGSRFLSPHIVNVCWVLFSFIFSLQATKELPNLAGYVICQFLASIIVIFFLMTCIRYYYVRNLYTIINKSGSSKLANISFQKKIASKWTFFILSVFISLSVASILAILSGVVPVETFIIVLLLVTVISLPIIGMTVIVIDIIFNYKGEKRAKGIISFYFFDDPLLYRTEFSIASIGSVTQLVALILANFQGQGIPTSVFQLISLMLFSLSTGSGITAMVALKRFIFSKRVLSSDYQQENNEDLETFLMNKEFFEMIKLFAEKEFSSENILLWEGMSFQYLFIYM